MAVCGAASISKRMEPFGSWLSRTTITRETAATSTHSAALEPLWAPTPVAVGRLANSTQSPPLEALRVLCVRSAVFVSRCGRYASAGSGVLRALRTGETKRLAALDGSVCAAIFGVTRSSHHLKDAPEFGD